MRKILFISVVFILVGCNVSSTNDTTEYDEALSIEEAVAEIEAAALDNDSSYEEPLATMATATYDGELSEEGTALDEDDSYDISYKERITANDRKVSFIDYQQTLALTEENFSSVYLPEDSKKIQEDPREMLGEQRKMPSLLVSSKFDDDYDKAMKGDPQAQYNLGLILSREENLRQQKAQAKEYFGKACAQGVQKSCDKYKTMKKAGY